MAHTIGEQKQLLNRARRLAGQVDVIIRALEDKADCSDTLHAISVCTGALDSLMAQVIEGHIRFHLLDPHSGSTTEQTKAAEDLIEALKTYLK
jgi:FrmR/RcnR family transcriptional regulator, repressor of frmRAB operon